MTSSRIHEVVEVGLRVLGSTLGADVVSARRHVLLGQRLAAPIARRLDLPVAGALGALNDERSFFFLLSSQSLSARLATRRLSTQRPSLRTHSRASMRILASVMLGPDATPAFF